MKKFFFALLVFLAMAATSVASPVNFDLGTGSYIDTSATGSGLLMWTNVYDQVRNEAFILSEGEDYTFLFSMMGTTEDWVNNDDLNPQSVTAYMDFDMPTNSNVSIPGFTVGTTAHWAFNQGWEATWSPQTVSLGDGTVFTVTLSDTSFQSGFWTGPDGLCGNAYANVFATVTLDQEPVPEPATFMLFGAGLVGLAGTTLRKRGAKRAKKQ